MRSWTVAGVLVAALTLGSMTGTAQAGKGKPTLDEAKKTAQAWIDAMNLGEDGDDTPSAAALAVTATPFYSIAMADAPDAPLCAESTAADAASVAKALVCLRGNVQKDGALRGWLKKDRKDSGSIFLGYVKHLQRIKNGHVVQLDMPCAGAFNDVVFAVVRDTDGALKVAGVVSTHGDCGE